MDARRIQIEQAELLSRNVSGTPLMVKRGLILHSFQPEGRDGGNVVTPPINREDSE